jgi:hypothetical protein
LCKELLKPPGHNTTGLGVIELEEIELRLRALARLERIWGKSGGVNANGVSNTSGGAWLLVSVDLVLVASALWEKIENGGCFPML